LLRHHVGRVLEVRPVFTRSPRRFPEMVGILPGRGRQSSKPKVMAVIDTSGSVTPSLLTKIDSELRGLARSHEVLVVECDCQVHRASPYQQIEEVSGRGGTDLRPPLEREFLRHHRPDLVVYFTDGEGPAPVKAPPVPVVWCLTDGGTEPAAWGRVVWMT